MSLQRTHFYCSRVRWRCALHTSSQHWWSKGPQTLVKCWHFSPNFNALDREMGEKCHIVCIFPPIRCTLPCILDRILKILRAAFDVYRRQTSRRTSSFNRLNGHWPNHPTAFTSIRSNLPALSKNLSWIKLSILSALPATCSSGGENGYWMTVPLLLLSKSSLLPPTQLQVIPPTQPQPSPPTQLQPTPTSSYFSVVYRAMLDAEDDDLPSTSLW